MVRPMDFEPRCSKFCLCTMAVIISYFCYKEGAHQTQASKSFARVSAIQSFLGLSKKAEVSVRLI